MPRPLDLPLVARWIDEHRERLQDELFQLLRMPSISASRRREADVRRAAQWLVAHLRRIGLTAELVETERHPLVVAESPPVPGRPVALVYGHYDVQPAEAGEGWESDPFQPTVRGGNVYARGATDDKGQMMTHVQAIQAWMAACGNLPLQVKLVLEGEEEIGSESLNRWLASPDAQRLAADVLVISDTSQFGPGIPAITYGLRGIAYFQLDVLGPNRDLHSGTFGGPVPNPANALCQILAGLVDRDGRIQLPGFYDAVRPLSPDERQQFAALPFDPAAFLADLGLTHAGGEAEYSILERRWARPTLDIHGLTSGYQEEGSKTVLPSRASAKFSFRLVPDQQPDAVRQQLAQRLDQLCPPGIRLDLHYLHGAPAIVTPLGSRWLAAAARAVEAGFGSPPVYIREGGSIPIIGEFQKHFGVEPLLLGWGRDDDNMHAPNEKFSLESYRRGMVASAHLWGELGKLAPLES